MKSKLQIYILILGIVVGAICINSTINLSGKPHSSGVLDIKLEKEALLSFKESIP
jgi:hypothetical protein